MSLCSIFYLAVGMLVLGDGVILLNAHRLVKAPTDDTSLSASVASLQQRQIVIVRIAVGVSIVAALAVFGYLLNRQGCFA